MLKKRETIILLAMFSLHGSNQEQSCDTTSADNFRALGKNSDDTRKMSQDVEITVHFSIIYILFTTLHAHIFGIKKVLITYCHLIFKN